ncbi:MAG: flagellar filament capping protein FliD [Burkholderiaceae bacterium]|jgi:flagellar hook-associated protein 2
MVGITSAGIGSGLDVEGIISKLMSVEQAPLTKIRSTETETKTKISIYGMIQSSANSLQAAAETLRSSQSLNPMKSASSDTTKISATASSTATAGRYSLTVSQLAQAQRLVADRVASPDTVIGTGSLNITLGSYDSVQNTFTADASKTPVTVTIGAGQQTLAGVRDAINNANAGVQASIVNDGQGYRLSIVSKETGAVNSLQITTGDNDGTNTDGSGLSQFAYNPTATAGSGKNLTEKQPALDALLKLNGIDIQKPGNTVTDAIDGVTFNLAQVTSTPVTIDVARDTDTLKTNLNTFVKAYNDLNGKLSDQQTKGATLQSDTGPGALQRQLRSLVTKTLPAYSSQISDIGLSFDKTGVLSLNNTKLDAALTKNPAIVQNIFADTGISTDARVSFISATAKTPLATYDVNVSTAPGNGVSVQGGFNNTIGIGLGNNLSAPVGSAMEGLNVKIANGASGALGTLTFSRGIATSLSNWVDNLNADGGALQTRTASLNNQLKRMTADETRLNNKLADIEKRYRAQYAALDTMIASMNQTSSYLTQQLSNSK